MTGFEIADTDGLSDHDLVIACHDGAVGVTMSDDYSVPELEHFGADILRYLGTNRPWKHQITEALDGLDPVADYDHYPEDEIHPDPNP